MKFHIHFWQMYYSPIKISLVPNINSLTFKSHYCIILLLTKIYKKKWRKYEKIYNDFYLTVCNIFMWWQ